MKKNAFLVIMACILFACSTPNKDVSNSSQTSPPPDLVIVSRTYNPANWETYSDPDGKITPEYDKVVISPNGVVWGISPMIGIVRIRQGTLEIVEPIRTDKGIPTAIAVSSDDDAWIGYKTGIISHYENGDWTDYKNLDERITAIAILGQKVWVGSDSETILSYNGHTWEQYDLNYGYVSRFAITPDNTLWASIGCSLGKYDNYRWTFYQMDYFEFQCGESIRLDYLTSSPDDSLWFKVIGYGLIHFQKGETWERYTEPRDITLSDWATHDFFAASNNILWIGMAAQQNSEDESSLVCFDGQKWVFFQDLPFHLIFDIDESPDGSLWLATVNGLYHYLKPNCSADS